MVLKNTELSFRVRQLEEKNSELERFKKELVHVYIIYGSVLSDFAIVSLFNFGFLCDNSLSCIPHPARGFL